MKYISVILLLVILFASCNKTSNFKNKTVSIQVELNKTNSINYVFTPLDRKLNWMFGELIKDHSFNSMFDISSPNLYQIQNNAYVFIEPGNNYDIKEIDSTFTITGKDSIGQSFLNSTKTLNTYWSAGFVFDEFKTLKSKLKALDAYLASDFTTLDSLSKYKLVSDSFYKHIKKTLNSYLEVTKGQICTAHYFRTQLPINNPNYINNLSESAINYWSQLYKHTPVTNKNIIENEFWYNYTHDYIFYYRGEFLQHIFFDFDKDDYFTQCISFSKTILKDEYLEYFIASFIFNHAKQKGYQKNLITAYQRFIKTYPDSKYTQYLTPEINLIKIFHKKIKADFNDNMVFIKNPEKINTLKELINLYNGQNIFIDVWATWCGPCIEEFKHSKILYSFLKKHDIKLVYLSFDENRTMKKWPEMIKYYNLEGDHIRNNDKLHKDLLKEFGSENISIPWYMIVNKKGEVVERHAKRPSDKDELYNQLQEKLAL